MSTDRTSRRLTAALTAALASAALIALAAGAAVPAQAQEPRPAQASPGEALAEALRASPVYVDPSLEAALPEADQRQIEAEIAATGIPIYVLMVPLIAGDPWGGDPQQLATVVHDHLGGGGVFITLARSSGGDGRLDAYEWPERQHQAKSAANTVTHEEELRDASLRAKLSRAIELIASGAGDAAYEAATEDLRDPPVAGAEDAEEAEDTGGSPVPLVLGVAVLLVAGSALLGLRLRARRRLPEDLMLPRTVFAAAQAATTDELRQHASRELVAFGQLVKKSPDFAAASKSAGASADLQVALDTYDAAAKVLDDARGTPDLAGVLVLIDLGRDHLARASAHIRGRQVPAPTPLCFFNPLHGNSATTVSWRPLGTRDNLRAAACAACAERVRARRAPEVLTDRLDGRDVPYFEVPPDRSVWAATGYGVLRGDLVQRILRGDHARARS